MNSILLFSKLIFFLVKKLGNCLRLLLLAITYNFCFFLTKIRLNYSCVILERICSKMFLLIVRMVKILSFKVVINFYCEIVSIVAQCLRLRIVESMIHMACQLLNTSLKQQTCSAKSTGKAKKKKILSQERTIFHVIYQPVQQTTLPVPCELVGWWMEKINNCPSNPTKSIALLFV